MGLWQQGLGQKIFRRDGCLVLSTVHCPIPQPESKVECFSSDTVAKDRGGRGIETETETGASLSHAPCGFPPRLLGSLLPSSCVSFLWTVAGRKFFAFFQFGSLVSEADRTWGSRTLIQISPLFLLYCSKPFHVFLI